MTPHTTYAIGIAAIAVIALVVIVALLMRRGDALRQMEEESERKRGPQWDGRGEWVSRCD